MVVDNDRLVKWVLNKFVGKITHNRAGHFGYTRQALFEEFLPAAYEGALVAAETFNPKRGFEFSTYAEQVIWRDLSEEFRRWRGHSAIDATREVSLDMMLEPSGTQSEATETQTNPRLKDTDFAVDPFEDIDEQIDAAAAVEALRTVLTPIEFEVLRLTGDGYTPKDISKRLSFSNGNARVILHRARAKAQKTLVRP